ncbi:MAG: HEXXH motif-containing putative peptide modification protein [Planctomycetota bacterium]
MKIDTLPPEIEPLCAGMPMVQFDYPYDRLLAASAAFRVVRYAKFHDAAADTSHTLDPLKIEEYTSTKCPYPLLDADFLSNVPDALRDITTTVSEWVAPFALPVVYRHYPVENGDAASCAAWPQQIAFGPSTFRSPQRLRENLIHEFCHQWHYILQEIVPFDRYPEFPRDLVLPSGTRGRTASEVIGALHVSVALAVWRTRRGRQNDVAPLRAYAQGCVDVLGQNDERLTPLGRSMMSFLERRMEVLSG